jgi:pantoate--beta-alanine ligase
METLENPKEVQRLADLLRCEGKRIGVVPTMGYLHEGHLSLVRAARAECDAVVATIFVNPTQFGPNEDLAAYPRDMERDKKLLTAEGTDYLFAPVKDSLYPEGFATRVEVDRLTDTLCGASRPWHFPGVALIVCKLFNIVKPHFAYFGQKDFQQAQTIRRMVLDLDFDLEVRVCPIVREPDGLAMSSRNAYLSEEERKQATVLYRALGVANEMYVSGERDAAVIKARMAESIGSTPLGKLDYAEVVDSETLHPIDKLEGKPVALVAAQFGRSRLIDNHLLGEPFPSAKM